jgi:Asp-tRNA(Asn)/Glu-tRNA(Gln) amidotransferase A subunit family amidase
MTRLTRRGAADAFAAATPALAAPPAPVADGRFVAEEATIPALQQAFREHRLTCHALVQTYLDRIAAYNQAGPKLNAILTLNGNALAQADKLDAGFARHGATGPLYCVPVVLKDNYNTADLPTSLASVTGYPAITVPAGFSKPSADAPIDVPVGMDILGRPFSEAKLLSIAYSFEQATHVRRAPESAPPLPNER